jgi:hypothetical protein
MVNTAPAPPARAGHRRAVGLAVPVLPLLATDQGASTVGVGLLFAAYAGALVAITPIGGLAVDRLGMCATMLVGLGPLAAATVLLVLVEVPVLLVGARAVQGRQKEPTVTFEDAQRRVIALVDEALTAALPTLRMASPRGSNASPATTRSALPARTSRCPSSASPPSTAAG